MTGKGEVIVNKINLKECKYFKGVGCIYDSFKFWGCTNLGGMCSEHPDCYFKQLKHKEQECDKYKQALDKIEEIANKQRKFDLTGKTPLTPVINEVGGDFIDILDIINKVREQ